MFISDLEGFLSWVRCEPASLQVQYPKSLSLHEVDSSGVLSQIEQIYMMSFSFRVRGAEAVEKNRLPWVIILQPLDSFCYPANCTFKL